MSLGEHIAPFVTETLGGLFENKPFAIEKRTQLLAPAEGSVLEIGAGTVDDQPHALAEIYRVLKPGGRYLFLEHVRAEDPALAQKQDRWEGLWKRVCFGCHPNRDTLPQIEAAFDLQAVERNQAPQGPRIVPPYVLGQAVKPD